MNNMAMTVHDVAAAVVARHHPIDQLKLQKIVFYAAGEYSALTGLPMFPEPIEAWDYGPVVYDLYRTYKHFEGEAAIAESEQGDPSKLNALEVGCVESALAQYGEHSGANLIDLTHKEPAWRDSYVAGEMRTEIPVEALVSSFRSKYATSTLSDEVREKAFAPLTRA